MPNCASSQYRKKGKMTEMSLPKRPCVSRVVVSLPKRMSIILRLKRVLVLKKQKNDELESEDNERISTGKGSY